MDTTSFEVEHFIHVPALQMLVNLDCMYIINQKLHNKANMFIVQKQLYNHAV